MPLSEQTQICYEIPITFDSVVEQTEAFSVHLTMETNLPNEVSQKLSVTNTVTTVNIHDSSKLTSISMHNNYMGKCINVKSKFVFTLLTVQ